MLELENILIGESAQDNWDLIDKSDPEWVWLHLKSFPSCHVVIKSCDPPSTELLNYAGECCKNKTKFKNLRNLKISFCKIKNLKKSEKTGSVYFISNRKVQSFMLK